MNPRITFNQSTLVSDASCLINLCASGQLLPILESLPVRVALPGYIAEREVIRFDIQPVIQAGLLTIIEPESEPEYEMAVNLSARFRADGEAFALAAAFHRNWALACDERRVLNHTMLIAPHLQLLTTPELVKFWADVKNVDATTVRRTLEAIATEGVYTIGERHDCYGWWDSHLTKSNAK